MNTTAPPPLAIPAERAALMRILIDMSRAAYEGILHEVPSEDGGVDANLVVALAAVILGHAEGNAMTQTEIADRIGAPRPSVIRRLDRLEDHGLIQRIDNKYYLEPGRAAKEPDSRMLNRFMEILLRAFCVLGPFLAARINALVSRMNALASRLNTTD
ncbi:MarR family transcriptional regulator [Bradyrhizobium sp. B117]|uniref:MarR family transcriptional regulator n=1 Tax=Bradyrhizobium sp. B117 TaxID=3140246 RepID=UPI00318371FA